MILFVPFALPLMMTYKMIFVSVADLAFTPLTDRLIS